MSNKNFMVVRSTLLSKITMVSMVLLTLVAAGAPFYGIDNALSTLVEFFYFLALAQMWNLLAGYGGLVSIGQQAYVGLGAYSLVAMCVFAGINPLISVFLAGIVSGLVAWPASKLLFKLQGPYFAIGTWVLAEVLRLVLANYTALGGGSGISITDSVSDMEPWWRESLIYWLAMIIGFGSLARTYWLLSSSQGLALTAVRDSEKASASLGVSVNQVKRNIYMFTAIGTGIIGALIFLTKLRVSPDAAFSIEWSSLIIFIVIIGGVGTIEGPIIGTVIYFLLRNYLSDFGSWYMIILGGAAILTMMFMREGIWGWVSKKYDLHLFPVQLRLKLSEELKK